MNFTSIKNTASEIYNNKVLQKDAKMGSFGYMFRSTECLVINTFFIVAIISAIFS
ncbi:TMhelix containing protein [Vibrio phage 1.101.O._10N.261.45.C6]|nr:TMhelix containing protein [Vibrio phage 1.101.O._10N.261.45.C6]